MKSIKISIIAILSLSIFAYSGGDITPTTVYEQEDIEFAQEETIEPSLEVPQQEEIVVSQEPIKEPEPIKKEPTKEIIPSGFYAGLGISGARYKTKCKCAGQSGTDKTVAITGRVGYDFNQYIGIEARGIKSVAKDDGGAISHAGLFIKPMYHIQNIVNLYALIGVAKTKTSGNLQKVDAESLALGGGVEVDLSKDIPKEGRYSREFDGKGDQERGLGLFLDYEKLVVKDNAPTLDAISAGVTYDF